MRHLSRRLLVVVLATLGLVAAIAPSGAAAAPAGAAARHRLFLEVSAPTCSVCDGPFTRAQGEPMTFVGGIFGDESRRPIVVQRLIAGVWRTTQHRKLRKQFFGFHVTTSTVGRYAVRAIAPRHDGHRRLVSRTVSWTVLLRTTVTASYAANPAPANSSVVVSGVVSPPGVRDLYVQNLSLTPVATSFAGTSAPDGSFSVSMRTTGPGVDRVLVVVRPTAQAAQGALRLPNLPVR